jgi:hypothetical protein
MQQIICILLKTIGIHNNIISKGGIDLDSSESQVSQLLNEGKVSLQRLRTARPTQMARQMHQSARVFVELA